MRKEFEIISGGRPGHPGNEGFFHAELKEYPRCTIAITDLQAKEGLLSFLDSPRKIYDVTDGEGTRYHYEIVVIHVEDENVKSSELDNIIEECWDWLLSYYLL